MGTRIAPAGALALLSVLPSLAQTTEGLISGQVRHAVTGRPLAGASIFYSNRQAGSNGVARSDGMGYYHLPLLPPGQYSLRAGAETFQPQEVYGQDLAVAGRLEIDFRLRPLTDVWEAGQYRSVFLPGSNAMVTFFGPDLDATRVGIMQTARSRTGQLESTVSQVVYPELLRDLPLAGRDAYTVLVMQPGVTADTTTARGLGLSVNGQRPSSSNFLLDGLENDNALVTGPLMPVAPEMIQEYRTSTNNFSAQYGRTSGYVANVVARAGGESFHGVVYSYFKNDILNANGFQENRAALARRPVREAQFGFQAGGPLIRRRLFFSSALERLRSRSRQDPVDFVLPVPTFAQSFTAPGSPSRSLLERFPAPVVAADPQAPWSGVLRVAPPVSVDRWLALERVDLAQGEHRLMARVAVSRLSRPDFIWTPYPDFISALSQPATSIGLRYLRALRPGLVNEASMGFSRDRVEWDRPHPEIPTLASGDGVALPGSPAFYAYSSANRTWQFLDNLVFSRNTHQITVGGGLLLRRSAGALTAARDGLYTFGNAILFGAGLADSLTVSLARGGGLRQPDFDRVYTYRQWFAFAQDTWRASPRLAVNYGLRYELYGAPRGRELLVKLGTGASLPERLAGARLSPGDHIYRTDPRNWAGRIGATWDATGAGRTLLRAAYGLFYDRPFDNLWQNVRNNSIALPSFDLTRPVDYLAPVASVVAGLGSAPASDFPKLTMFDPAFRNGYAQTWFYGIQQALGGALIVEINGLGSLGRRLLTTDIVNRQFTTAVAQGRLNPALPDIAWRAGQGSSSYQAVAAVARYRGAHAQLQAAYTLSHTIDNQSDALAGDFFDLSFTRITAAPAAGAQAAFPRQFDSGSSRGNSDFDQRHNLVFYSVWDLPRLRNWKVAQLAAFRSGFPYTVYAAMAGVPPRGQGLILDNRADLAASLGTLEQAVPGGKLLLDRTAFAVPSPGRLGTTGRNAFRGPGLYSMDLSLGRTFAIREVARITLRADAFNVLNHANLNNPASLLPSRDFGTALYGRVGRQSGFPAVGPLDETARQVQVLLKVEW